MKFAEGTSRAWAALAAVLLAPASQAQTITLSATWPDQTARPVRIAYQTEAGVGQAKADQDYSDKWVQQVATRFDQAKRERRTILDLYFGDYPLSTPIRIAPGETQKQLFLDSKRVNCSVQGANQLEEERRSGLGNQAVALKVAISAKRALDGLCAHAPGVVVNRLGTTLAEALCDYARYGDATYDLIGFAAAVPSSIAPAQRSEAQNCSRNRSGLVRAAINSTQNVLNAAQPDLIGAAKTVAQLLELSKQSDLTPTFGGLGFDPADYSGHLLSLQYRELLDRAGAASGKPGQRQELEAQLAQLQAIATASPGTEANRAFMKSQLNAANFQVLASLVNSVEPSPTPVPPLIQPANQAYDQLIADTAVVADNATIPG